MYQCQFLTFNIVLLSCKIQPLEKTGGRINWTSLYNLCNFLLVYIYSKIKSMKTWVIHERIGWIERVGYGDKNQIVSRCCVQWIVLDGVLVSLSCCNKVPPTVWLQRIESLTVMEAWSLKSRWQQSPASFLAFSSF